MPRTSIFTLFDLVEGLCQFGDRSAIGVRQEFGVRWWSYERLQRESRYAARAFAARGIGKGDRVLIQAPNSPEWVGTFLGLMLLGAVVVPTEHDGLAEVSDRIAAIVEPKLRLQTRDLVELFKHPAGEERPGMPHFRCTVTADDPAILFFTSGTTSAPRGVALTHGNLASQIASFSIWQAAARLVSVRILVMAPLSHAQGIMLGVAIPLALGLCVIYTNSSEPKHLIRTLRDNRVLFLSTVPRMVHLLAQVFLQQAYSRRAETLESKLKPGIPWILRRHYIFTSMRRSVGYCFWVVLVGGAPLPKEDEHFWRDSGCLLVQGYGLTETTAVMSVNLPIFGRFGSVGRPIGHQELKIADDGEILVRGPNVMRSYFGEMKTEHGESNGFLRTGDLGYLDAQGRLYIRGRKKEVIITGEGFNVYPGDVEAVLNRVPGVRDSLVMGLEQDGHTQVNAVLLLDAGANAGSVIREANQYLLNHQRIANWVLWPESDFPRGGLMKPKRKLIADRIQQPSYTPPSMEMPPVLSMEELLRIENKHTLIRELARFLIDAKPGTIEGGTASLVHDLGLTSLDTIELMTAIERSWGTTVERIAIEEKATVNELHALLQNPDVRQGTRKLYQRDAARWPELLPFVLARRVFSPLILSTLVHLRATVRVEGVEHLTGLRGPIILSGIGHEHALDVLLIYVSLPKHMRERVGVVASRWVFSHYLDPGPETSWLQRTVVGLGFHLLVPLFFPMVLSSPFGRAREGLFHAGRLIDRGYSLISFEGHGVAVVAAQCGIPVVPVHLTGNHGVRFRFSGKRSHVTLRFDKPTIPRGEELSDA